MLLETAALGRAAARIMEQTTFAEHYRICAKGDGSPRELSRTGSAITCKAKDIRSGEPVALKLIPIASVDPAAREQFEEQARAAQLLDHITSRKSVLSESKTITSSSSRNIWRVRQRTLGSRRTARWRLMRFCESPSK